MNGLIPESITLSIFNQTGDKFGVVWQTEFAGAPILEYTEAEDLDFSKAKTINGVCDKGMNLYKNSAVIDVKDLGSSLRWRVGDKSGIYSDAFVTKIPSNNKDKLTFLLITDTQDEAHHGSWLKYLIKDATAKFPSAELLIHTGDIVQEGGNTEWWRLMLENGKDLFLSLPMVYVSGNHDYWHYYLYGNKHIAKNHFHIDHPPQDTSHGVYYSFDIGPAHFTVLSSGDSMETDNKGLLEEQYQWAVDDITHSQKNWKIVCIHNPLYSPGKYGCRPPLNSVALALREQFNKVFADAGVDLVLCGHDHVYSQTFPIDRNGEPIKNYTFEILNINDKSYKAAVSPGGPIHFESGCAGHQDRGIEPVISEDELSKFEKISPMTYGTVAYSAIEINKDILTVCYRKVSVNDGECFEENKFAIKKHSL